MDPAGNPPHEAVGTRHRQCYRWGAVCLLRPHLRKHQHYSTSAARQREAAESAIANHGAITIEFFDTGCSRRLPWARRPQAAALLARLDSPDRSFEAIVVGEYERAFTNTQFSQLLPLFQHHNTQMWLPEAGGPVNTSHPAHQALMTMLGAQSHREVLRARHRVLAAMSAQTRQQGRYLGGRPPYGYRLADAGPTRIGPTHDGDAAPSDSTPIQRPRPTCSGSSPNA